MRKPTSYLSAAKSCLFFTLNVKDDGTVIIVSTRHKHSVLILNDEDVSILARSKFFYDIADAFVDDDLPTEYEENLRFNPENEHLGGKRIRVSLFS